MLIEVELGVKCEPQDFGMFLRLHNLSIDGDGELMAVLGWGRREEGGLVLVGQKKIVLFLPFR